jgi:3-oxoacyl-[acyl-carrier protein] reductase
VAIITGVAAPQGLGNAIADAFGKECAKAAVCDINEKAVKERAGEIAARGNPCPGLRCDVSSVESVQELFTKVVQKFGTVDILFNNAALIPTKPADEERRNRQYAYFTTAMPRKSLGITMSLTDHVTFNRTEAFPDNKRIVWQRFRKLRAE